MTTATSNRGYRHSTATMRRARELHAAGWSYYRIAQLLGRELDVSISQTTVMRWCDPEQHAKAIIGQRQRNRTVNTAKRSGRLGVTSHTVEFQEHRARRLHERGQLSHLAVQRVMAFDYPGQGWTAARVRELLARPPVT